jgi:tryptophanyl-tRNA synthetase
MSKRLFSAMQPTGELHIGNYLGALKNWVKLQDEYEAIFSIVDYHAITIPYQPKEMQNRILNLAMDYLAAGIDPKKSIIFVQSHVPEHTELAWILNTLTPIADLKRMHQFKEKSKEHPGAVNMGLFDYPVLQAADILLYKTQAVPVGEDQKQHVELARDLARRFNQRFGKIFPEPEVILTKGYRIMGLDNPKKKMSKSYGSANYIGLADSPEIIWKKLSTAVTDPARQRREDRGHPEKCNLYTLHQLFSTQKQQKEVSLACREAKFGCLDCKKILAKNISQELAPFRKKRAELAKEPEKVRRILDEGAERAKKIAEETLKKVKEKMGLV